MHILTNFETIKKQIILRRTKRHYIFINGLCKPKTIKIRFLFALLLTARSLLFSVCDNDNVRILNTEE